MTLSLVRTDHSHPDFHFLVNQLDHELAIRDGEEHAFFAQYNQPGPAMRVVVAYEDGEACGCGAFKPYGPGVVEIKRMFVPLSKRGRGIAGRVLAELEKWAAETGHHSAVLETGVRMPEAIALYTKSGYRQIPNYGQYAGVESSVCFAREWAEKPLAH